MSPVAVEKLRSRKNSQPSQSARSCHGHLDLAMNSIRAAMHQTRFASEPHLMIFIDDVPLGELLERIAPDIHPAGLVPAWLGWMIEDREQEVTWERMVPPAQGKARVPVLVCPDDLDFSCSLVVADLEAQPDRVLWLRMGLDATESNDPACVGEQVHWFEGMPALTFRREDYEACVKAFQVEAKGLREKWAD